jgi:toxin ParE1/3/4
MKTYDVLFTPAAVEDLRQIYAFIAEQSGHSEIALSYMQTLRVGCEKLSIAPMRGQARDDIREGLRIIPLEGKVVAAFEVRESSVLILSILYGGRDYETLLG